MIAKSSRHKTLTGTLGGVAEHFSIDYAWLKISFGALALMVGPWAAAAYLVLFLIMPNAPGAKLGVNIFAGMARRLVYDLRLIIFRSRYSRLFGFTFLTLGILWLRERPSAGGIGVIPAALLLLGVVLLFDLFSRRKIDMPYGSYMTYQTYPTPERPN